MSRLAMDTPTVTKRKNEKGAVEYHLGFDSAWDGVDSFVTYLQRQWNGEVSEAVDSIYSRRWVVRAAGVSISIYHDSQLGNFFLREDGVDDLALLEEIALDVAERMK